MSLERAAVLALPKVDLHCHLDGAVRPGTLLEIAQAAGIPLPADTVEELLPHVRVSPDCRTLRDFLLTFETFYPVLNAPGSLERAGYELLEDAAADGVVHLEARFCPALQATDGHSAEDVLREALAGLASGGRDHGVSWGAILCLYRSEPPEVNAALTELALAYADRGVVGVDLAGPEDMPGEPFAEDFRRLREAGLPVTIHAGEACGPESIVEAMDGLVATRIGHAVALREDAALADRVRQAGLALECCLTSNLQTGAVSGLDAHPFDALHRAGHLVTLNTDDPAVSGITLTDEYLLAAATWGYDLEQLRAFALAALEAAFLDEAGRAALRARIEAGTV